MKTKLKYLLLEKALINAAIVLNVIPGIQSVAAASWCLGKSLEKRRLEKQGNHYESRWRPFSGVRVNHWKKRDLKNKETTMNHDERICYFTILIGYNSDNTKSDAIVEYPDMISATGFHAIAIDCLRDGDEFEMNFESSPLYFRKLTEIHLHAVKTSDYLLYKQDLKQLYPFANIIIIGQRQ
jgi:hypothetical protein